MVLLEEKEIIQDTYVYYLVSGRNIVYIGITNNPKRRLQEHKKSKKIFTKMKILNKRAMKKENAERVERKELREFKQKYGRLPRYNISHNGQFIFGASSAIRRTILNRINEIKKIKIPSSIPPV